MIQVDSNSAHNAICNWGAKGGPAISKGGPWPPNPPQSRHCQEVLGGQNEETIDGFRSRIDKAILRYRPKILTAMIS